MEAMATKAERYRSEAQRSASSAKKKAKAGPKKRAAAPRGSAKARKAAVAFEETPPAVPASRKSTRRSMHHQKSATALTSRTLLIQSSPRNRHDVGPPTQRAPR
jgi:hypothetical protein